MSNGANYRESEDCVVVYADNYINDIEGEKLEDMCDALLKKGYRKLVVDFSETDIINSIGVSILIGVIEKIKEKDCALSFSGLKKVNHNIFDVIGITRHVSVYPTEDEALGAQGAAPGPASPSPGTTVKA